MRETYLCESSADGINLYCIIFFIAPYNTMQKTLEHININLHIKRLVLTNLHKFVTHIKKNVTLW